MHNLEDIVNLELNTTPVEHKIDWKERALKAEKKLDDFELVAICATDIVDAWPKLTLRTLGSMTKSIDMLRQAINASKK